VRSAAEPGDPEDLHGLLPVPGGQVVITPRDAAGPHPEWPIEVDILDPQESLAFLKRRLAGIRDPDANELAASLGDLPLALAQAVNWLTGTAMTVSEYVQTLGQYPHELLSEGVPSSYPLPVAATYSHSFEQIRRDPLPAFKLLQLCAFFGPDPISVPVLAREAGLADEVLPVTRDSIELNRAIRLLRRHALIQVDRTGSQLWVHPLVKAILRERMTAGQPAEATPAVHRVRSGAVGDDVVVDGPLHHAIVAMDVVGSGVRDDVLQRAMRDDLRRIVCEVLRRQSLDPAQIPHTDLGDGVRLIVPAHVTPVALLDPLVANLASALRRHRWTSSDYARLRLRVNVHMGFLQRDADGWNGVPLVEWGSMLYAM